MWVSIFSQNDARSSGVSPIVPKLKAILKLATALVEKRGQVSDGELQAARDGGLSDAEVLEALAIVALNTFTNYINALVRTKVDFPTALSID